jgi:hypothetical protein
MCAQEDEAAHALVVAREGLAACAQDCLDLLVFIKLFDRMIKERVANEVVLAFVVATDEGDRQGQDSGARVPAWVVRHDEVASRLVPHAQVPVEAVPRLLRQVGQNGSDANFCRLVGAVDVLPTEEIMFVDNGPACQPLRTKNEVERFADRGFSDVVAANEQRVATAEDNGAGKGAAKILDSETL